MLSQLVGRTALAVIVSVLCALSGNALGAQPNASGAPEGWAGNSASGPIALAPSGFDDTLTPLNPPGGPFPARPDTRDLAASDQAVEFALPLWGRLAQIEPELRGHVRIEIELGSDASPTLLDLAPRVARLWNSGESEKAIGSLRAIEESGARMALGIDWSSVRGPGGLRDGGTDIRLGTRTGGRGAALDYSRRNGNVFSVVQWGSLTGDSYWMVFLSSNHGATWSQTYEYYSNTGIIDVDAAVVGDYVYVGYIMGGASNQLRMRRCLVSDGTSDSAYAFKTILTAATGTLTETSVATNSDDFDNRVYAAAITSLNTLRFLWDVAADGTTFTEDSPTTSNPESGLDAAWSTHYQTGNPILFASYAGTDGAIYVHKYSSAGAWTTMAVAADAGLDKDTSISAFELNVICAYETDTAMGKGIDYRISYNAGVNWSQGNLATPDGTDSFTYGNPSVDARTGYGTSVIYWEEKGEPDPMFFRCRQGYAAGAWAEESTFNDFDAQTGAETALCPLSFEPGFFDVGAVYNGSTGTYFDRPYSPTSAVPQPPAASLRLAPASPNPFSDQTEIRFVLAQPGHVSLQLFDMLGRRVAVLLDRPLGAGSHAVPLRGQGLGSSVYYYRLASGTEQMEGRLTRIR